MARPDQSPVSLGHVFCSPWCGFKCSLALHTIEPPEKPLHWLYAWDQGGKLMYGRTLATTIKCIMGARRYMCAREEVTSPGNGRCTAIALGLTWTRRPASHPLYSSCTTRTRPKTR